MKQGFLLDPGSYATVIRVEEALSKLSDPFFKVFAALCKHANSTARSCFPSVRTLAKLSGKSERTVQRAIAEFEAIGLIVRAVRTNADGSQTTNEYQLVLTGTPVTGQTPPGDHVVTPPVTTAVTPSIGQSNTTVVEEAFDLEATLKRWEAGADAKFRLLAYYIRRRKIPVPNKAALIRVVGANIEAAKLLKDYPRSEVEKAMKSLDLWERREGDTKKWRLSSVVKELTK